MRVSVPTTAVDEAVAKDMLSRGLLLPKSVYVVVCGGGSGSGEGKYQVLHPRQPTEIWQTLALYDIELFITQDPELLVSIPRAWEKARVAYPTEKKTLQVLVGRDSPAPRCVLYSPENGGPFAAIPATATPPTTENVSLS